MVLDRLTPNVVAPEAIAAQSGEEPSEAMEVVFAEQSGNAEPGVTHITTHNKSQPLYVTRVQLGGALVHDEIRRKTSMRPSCSRSDTGPPFAPVQIGKSRTVNVGKDELIVIGSSTDQLTNALATAVAALAIPDIAVVNFAFCQISKWLI